MVVNVKEKPTNIVVSDFFRAQFSSSTPPPPPKSQSQDPRIRDIGSLSNIFENFKFSKMLDEEAILRIRGSCDCDGGKLDDENCGQKNRKRWFNKPSTHSPPSITVIAEALMGNENRAKKIENVVDFFGAIFINHPHIPPPHRNHHRTLDG